MRVATMKGKSGKPASPPRSLTGGPYRPGADATPLAAESESLYHDLAHAIIPASPVAIIAIDTQGRVILWSPAAERIFGWSASEVLGRPLPYIPPELREQFLVFCRWVRGGEAIVGAETVRMRKDGTRIDVVLSGAPLRDASGRVIGSLGIYRDITEQKRLRESQQRAMEELTARDAQLRSMASSVSLAEERDRRRLAEALHDNVGQTLAMAKLRLAAIRAEVRPPRLAEELSAVLDLINQALERGRSLTLELSCPALYELGLGPAVEQLVEQMARRCAFPIEFDDDRRPKPLGTDVRVVLYQGARELLMNALKHAQPRRVRVRLRREGDRVRLTVEDDGVGFDVARMWESVRSNGGLGIFSLRERLRHLGGGFEVESRIGQGTRVSLSVRVSAPTKEGPT